MERLTERNPFWIDNEMWLNACEPTDEEIEAVYHRLKEYEDLEDRLNKVYDCDGLLLKVVETIEKHPKLLTDEEVDKWEEYKRLEQQGRLVKLPCKVGNTVYVVTSPFNVFDDIEYDENMKEEVYESYVSSVSFYECGEQYRIYAKATNHFIGAYFRECDFGKTVFLTKSEAEARLKELRGEENGK